MPRARLVQRPGRWVHQSPLSETLKAAVRRHCLCWVRFTTLLELGDAVGMSASQSQTTFAMQGDWSVCESRPL